MKAPARSAKSEAVEVLTEPSLDLSRVSTADLRAAFCAVPGQIIERLHHAAAIWKELERRGEDLSDLRAALKGLGFYIPFIAAGTVDPLAVVRFATKSTLLRHVVLLPIDQQRHLAAGGLVTVYLGGDDDAVELDPLSLKPHLLARVFDGKKGIRPPEEQRVYLARVAERQTAPMSGSKVRFDPELRAFKVGRTTIPMHQISRAVTATQRPAEIVAERREALPQVPARYARAVRARAEEMGLSPEELVIRALQAMGIGGEAPVTRT